MMVMIRAAGLLDPNSWIRRVSYGLFCISWTKSVSLKFQKFSLWKRFQLNRSQDFLFSLPKLASQEKCFSLESRETSYLNVYIIIFFVMQSWVTHFSHYIIHYNQWFLQVSSLLYLNFLHYSQLSFWWSCPHRSVILI